MNKWLITILLGILAASFSMSADAQRRFGGGKSFGRQSAPVQQRQATPPAQNPQQAAPTQPNSSAPAGGAAAAAPASPWRGALMGVAAGLGIAALASHFGLGGELGTLMMFLIIGFVLMMLIRVVMSRMRGAPPAQAYQAPVGASPPQAVIVPTPVLRNGLDSGARPGSAMDEFARAGSAGSTLSAAPFGVPADFDTPAFLSNAKAYYAKLQTAWDDGDVDQLADFTSNEMFISLTHDLRARAGAKSHTEILALDATLLGIESSASEHLASVKFDGSLKVDGDLERVQEVWNLAKPATGRGGWVLAGIQQIS